MTTGNDEFYTYDGLYELTIMQRGDLNPTFTGITGTPVFEEDFFFDPTGNWNGTTSWNASTTGYRTKTNGTTDLDQNRSHNMANEITGITTAVGSAWPAPSEDMDGNITTMPQPNALTSTYSATYDAWNRLVKLMSGISTVGIYKYDGLNRRAQKAAGGITRDYFYSVKWQILEERSSSPNPGCTDRSFVWGLRYDDDLIARDPEPTSSSSASCPGMTERFYALHDQFHVTAAMNTTATVVERYGYDSFGFGRVMTGAFAARTATLYEWETRYGAYRWEKESQLYQVRNRYLHSKLGRWISRDPAGYGTNFNLYEYADNSPTNGIDATGLGQATAEDCLAALNCCALMVEAGMAKDLAKYGIFGIPKGTISGAIIKAAIKYIVRGTIAEGVGGPIGWVALLVTTISSFYLLGEKLEYWRIRGEICQDNYKKCCRRVEGGC